ncbi:MerR family transcriptional regulator [Acetanaerobacterium elongatum]|uniref:Transcriptional regulator, MerR family n=1 Tax=Acetanaerobacterium elongatum TaxID=258515 RepID=A0A1H0DTQ9_9FIRM|nr:MerR family transcriptional regulator [Acetanaerobacterium elongatum]SDN73627.1 transcriptional regulator, MerR family [Acetanaerobacterium elongatum]
MQIHELCTRCHVTKKAVEYYIGEGLLCPQLTENGYRRFSDEDAATVDKITLLRRLGMSVADIRSFLSNGDKNTIVNALKESQLKLIEQARDRRDCLDILLQNGCELEACSGLISGRLGEPEQILEKLRLAFPGDYGLFLSVHFGRYLNFGIDSEEKAEAYQRILDFLDTAPKLEFPEDLKGMLENMLQGSPESAQSMDNAMMNAFENFDGFMKDKQDFIKQYLEYRTSEDYLSGPVCRMQNILKQFMQSSGYYDVFFPNLMILSDSYSAYHTKLTALNDEMLAKYPELSALTQS